MNRTTKIRAIGSSAGVILPKELLDELHLSTGDELSVVRTADGVLLTPRDANFERAMASFEKGRRKYRNALRELAK